MTHKVALCAIPLPHCHGDCDRIPIRPAICPSQGSHRASLQASGPPTPPGRAEMKCRRTLHCFEEMVGASFPNARQWQVALPPARTPRPALALSTLPSPRVGAGTLAGGSLMSATNRRHVSLLCSPTRTARPAQDFCAAHGPRPRPRAMSSIARPAFTLRFCPR